jgi:hypothetical protein
MARPTHPGPRGLAARGLLESCAGIVAGRTRGAPLTRADVATLRATIRLLSSLKASRVPAVWAIRLEAESVRRPPITPRLS